MSQTKVKSGLLNFPDQTDFVKLPSGTTAQRPSSPEKGYSRYNTTDNKLEYWNGTIWQQLPGIVAPTIQSVSYPGDDLAADPAGGQTITLTGTNFLNGASIEIDGTTASVVTVVSSTEITFTAPAKAAGDYDILLTNGDSTTATYVDGMTYNGLPSWTTPAGNLGTFAAGSTIPTITLVATEPDSGVVSYSVTTGALPTGLALTGADIDGTVSTPAGQTTYNFSVTASDDENQSTERAFNIVVYLQVKNTVSEVDPFGDSSGVALYRLENNANDEGGVYNGTPSNVTYGTGVFGQAGVFNGSNSNVFSSAGFTGNPIFSISFWVNPSSTLGTPFLFGGNSNGVAFLTYINSSSKLNFGRWGDSLGDSIASVPNNTWTHIAISNNSGNVQLYINGDADLSFSTTYNILNTNFYIGSAASSQYFNGLIDQVRILDKAITPLEVESLYRERTVVCGGQADTLDILGDNSCIAAYQLNGNANDLSGNYSGTPTNLSYGVGEFDLAGVFNGSSSKIDLGNNSSNNSSVISVSLWFKTSGHSGTGTIINNGGANSNETGYYLGLTSSGYLRFNATGVDNIDGSVNYADGSWHNIIMTLNNGAYNVYVDGNTTPVINGTGIFTSTATRPTWIGQFSYTPANIEFWNGSIDQVRIFNKALNSTEVTTLYNETACDALACSGTTNTLDILSDGSCIAAYPLDGSPADLSGNYNAVQKDVTYPVGKFDLAASFNGSSSSINTNFTVPALSTYSASIWFKTTSTSRQYLFSDYNSGGADFSTRLTLSINSGNFVVVLGNGSTSWINSSVDASSYLDGNWHNLIYTIDGSSVKLYADGNATPIGNLTSTVSSGAAGTQTLKIGTSGFLAHYFNGSIDQVRIFNKALSSAEVTTLYNETACN